MKKPTRLLAAILALALVCSTSPLAQRESDEAKRVRDAVTVFSEMSGAGDKSIPQSILARAEGIAVFPGLIKGGFIIGAMHGRGILSAHNSAGWSAPAFLSIDGGSFGAQIGATAVDIVLVIMNPRGLTNLVGNQFKVGADAGVAAGPVGRDATAATDIQMRAQILSYSRSRGLFAGITLNGSTFRADRDANERFYGRKLDTKQIVIEGGAGSPGPVGDWISALQAFRR